MNEANRLLNNNYGTCMVTMVQYNVYDIQSVDAMRTYDKIQAKMWKIGLPDNIFLVEYFDVKRETIHFTFV